MENCARCGHRLGAGRYCTGCGDPVEPPRHLGRELADWRTDTAERPAIRDVPPAPRYPLYADEAPPVPTDRRSSRRRGWLPWVAGGTALVLSGVLGVGLLTGGEDEEADSAPAAAVETSPAPAPSSATPEAQPTRRAGSAIERKPEPRDPVDVAATARLAVPATAPPSQGLDGTRTSYDAGNLVDGDTGTAWRMSGDGSGEELVLRLGRPTTVTSLGILNGYAKRARGPRGGVLDWYTGNRRVLAVEWVLDDGTTLRHDLGETRTLQTTEVGAITTRTVRLRLVSVSSPGPGRAGRDYTALSELSVVGLPG